MNQGLSVLIPTYNVVCISLVEHLYVQLVTNHVAFEIIVADDGSTQPSVIEENREINQFSHCQYLERGENVGRAAIRNFLSAFVTKTNEELQTYAFDHPETAGMGTTIVIAWLWGDKAYICWCGDSRCYVFNENLGLTRLSKDHSYVQELVDRGELSPENAHNHPYSNVITRCLGDLQNRAVPDTHIHYLKDGDIFMLCSDGLTDMLTDEKVQTLLNDDADASLLCHAANEAGGYDNVSVCLIKIV